MMRHATLVLVLLTSSALGKIVFQSETDGNEIRFQDGDGDSGDHVKLSTSNSNPALLTCSSKLADVLRPSRSHLVRPARNTTGLRLPSMLPNTSLPQASATVVTRS